jgi:hypothetical protein
MREIFKSGSVRGVKLYYKAEYCGTPQSGSRRKQTQSKPKFHARIDKNSGKKKKLLQQLIK